MKALEFKITPIDKRPKIIRSKGSKYDPILHSFEAGTNKLAKLNLTDKHSNLMGNYVAKQLRRRIDQLKLSDIDIYVSDKEVYLEKPTRISIKDEIRNKAFKDYLDGKIDVHELTIILGYPTIIE